jgi:ABC-type branched-subunit amino acid transport system ATPase component
MTTATSSRLDEVFDNPIGAQTGPLLELRDVSMRFGGIYALAHLDLEIGAHDVVAIIGPNGAGKTTTLNAICRIIPATGTITFRGESLADAAPSKVAAAGVGRSFQDPPLIDNYTVIENVLCGAHLRLRYRMADQIFRRRRVDELERRMVRRAEVLLDFVGLADQAGKDAGSLSFGARKLVDIARAMIGGPQLLLLDEPSSGLDAHERAALQAILLELRREERVAVLAVEHHMDLVRAAASHVIAMQAGAVLMTGTPTEVLDSDLFRAAVVGSSHDDGPTDPQARS